MNKRIIAKLDIKGPNLVKGIHLEGLRILGNPSDFAKFYYDDGIDELVYNDIVASLYGRDNLLEIVKKTSEDIFIPICAGGGIRNLDDIQAILKNGADKILVNSAAVRNPHLLKNAVKEFGTSTIVSYISSKKRLDGSYEVYIDNGRQRTYLNTFDWVKQVYDLGVGEIIIESINQEGTGKGVDLDLVKKVSESVPIPFIATGGVGKKEHIIEVFQNTTVNAVSLASILHYKYMHFLQFDKNKFSEGNADYLLQKSSLNTIVPETIFSIKEMMIASEIETRLYKNEK